MNYIELEGMKLYKVDIYGIMPDGTLTSDYVEVLAKDVKRAKVVASQRLKTSPILEGVVDRSDIRVEQVSSNDMENYPIILDKSGLVKCLFK